MKTVRPVFIRPAQARARTGFCGLALTLLLACASICASGCAFRYASPESYLAHHGGTEPDISRFTYCRAFGCSRTQTLGFTPSEWREVEALFLPPPETPKEERQRIAQAVARMESIAGGKAGTHADLGRNAHPGGPGQLDCVAETANTTTFLLLLRNSGLLAFHGVSPPGHRGFFIILRHNAAVVAERGTGREYAVDSWHRDNGDAPVVLPLAEWEARNDSPDEEQTTDRAEGGGHDDDS